MINNDNPSAAAHGTSERSCTHKCLRRFILKRGAGVRGFSDHEDGGGVKGGYLTELWSMEEMTHFTS